MWGQFSWAVLLYLWSLVHQYIVLAHQHIQCSSSITTLPYLDKDQLGGYTMLSGDIVLFNLAVDRRSGAQRATNVQLHRLIEEQKDKNAREMVSFYVCCLLLHNRSFYG